ncbi:MAG: deoxyguanosinetriphosphate triphosphohydrolase [Nitrospirae bacterium]|nr:deoxyguanosinetriphosphate triphosphohydrolase [Nitrospirota bacterium]
MPYLRPQKRQDLRANNVLKTIREQTEDIETSILHPNACLSRNSKGRHRSEKEDNLRTCFQRDRDRIIHSKSFRRLKHKTQVFLAPQGDHYRTRLTHVLEVSQIARTITRALRLNEDLTEAIALGHDLGHTPFGHAGESVLNELHPGGFDHYKQSLRVVDMLEKNGKGLNLTFEVRDGIDKHSKGIGDIVPKGIKDRPCTLEGSVVRISDIIAYVNHDLDDALRAGVLKRKELPSKIIKVIGDSSSKRINTMVTDVVVESLKKDLAFVKMSRDVETAVYGLRDFLFERVYYSEAIIKEFKKARIILKALYEHYLENAEGLTERECILKTAEKHRAVCDFVAGMTDSFALMTYERLFLPQQWAVL